MANDHPILSEWPVTETSDFICCHQYQKSLFAKLEDQDSGAIMKGRSEVTEPEDLGNDGISKKQQFNKF